MTGTSRRLGSLAWWLLGRRTPQRRPWLARVLRLPLWMAAVLIVVGPFTVAWQMYRPTSDSAYATQQDPPPSEVTEEDLAAWRTMGTKLPDRAAPVVLSYHDIRPDSADRYVVSPANFDQQMAALAAAGYRTLSTAELVDYLRGGPVPPRSVYLTFDDGTSGLFTWADRILERHRMRAASFLISGRVGRYQPYYLAWREVKRMAASGRWDFQAHTHDLHTRGPVGPKRINGSLLTGSAWVSDTRMETVQEHRQRIATDFRLMFDDFAQQGLPAPQVFAYPFSDLGISYDREARESTADLVAEQFAGALTNKVAEPTPVSRRSAPGRLFERIEVFADTRADDLLAEVARWTATPAEVEDALADRNRWWDERTRSVARISILDGRGAAGSDGDLSYFQAAYAPYATADWTDYTVAADVHGLHRRGNGANIIVRFGSAAETAVRTSCCGVQIVRVATGSVLAQRRVAAAESHHVAITVHKGSIAVVVDGLVRLRVPNAAGVSASGGIALASRRGSAVAWPYFDRVSVSQTRSSG